jgi:hypothetical protein
MRKQYSTYTATAFITAGHVARDEWLRFGLGTKRVLHALILLPLLALPRAEGTQEPREDDSGNQTKKAMQQVLVKNLSHIFFLLRST